MARGIDSIALEYWREKKRRQQISEELAKKPPKDSTKSTDAPVRVNYFSNAGEVFQRMKTVGKNVLYVGIPSNVLETRTMRIANRVEKFTSKRKKSQREAARLAKVSSKSSLSDAYLLYLFERGSRLTGQPARPVLKPAIHAPWNKKEIAALIAKSVEEEAKGQHYKAKQTLMRAGRRAVRAAKDWFDDPRNGWAPNSASVFAHKGFDKPGIDTGSMRDAITFWLKQATEGASTPISEAPGILAVSPPKEITNE